VGALSLPAIERTTLGNGIPVTLARRGNVPTVLVTLTFDAGFSADLTDPPGTQSLMMALLDEGTTTRDATTIAEEQERLGARLSTGAGLDASSVTLAALTANLARSIPRSRRRKWSVCAHSNRPTLRSRSPTRGRSPAGHCPCCCSARLTPTAFRATGSAMRPLSRA
jgi:hypothetical protein